MQHIFEVCFEDSHNTSKFNTEVTTVGFVHFRKSLIHKGRWFLVQTPEGVGVEGSCGVSALKVKTGIK